MYHVVIVLILTGIDYALMIMMVCLIWIEIYKAALSREYVSFIVLHLSRMLVISIDFSVINSIGDGCIGKSLTFGSSF